jgi:hypothetical protein
MILSTAAPIYLVLVSSLIGKATGLSPFGHLAMTAGERLEATLQARRMATSEADQKCIDDTAAMFGPCSCGDDNVTETELTIAQNEALAQCPPVEEYVRRNVTIDEGTANETTVEVVEKYHADVNMNGCDVVPLYEGECIDAGGFVARIPDLDLRCDVVDITAAVLTSSLRGVDDCFAASCESTVQKLQSGSVNDLLGFGILAGPQILAMGECEATLVGDQFPAGDDATTSGTVSITTNSFHAGGIFLSLVAFVVMI